MLTIKKLTNNKTKGEELWHTENAHHARHERSFIAVEIAEQLVADLARASVPTAHAVARPNESPFDNLISGQQEIKQ